jgi:RNA polymerase sigma factor (TIGR02999 family)
MSANSSRPVSELLAQWKRGDEAALGSLVPLVYDELRRVAHHHLRAERQNHTLQTTGLVHEAYLRLVGNAPLRMDNRTHFFAVASHLMRQILVDYARKHGAAKRGSNCLTVSLEATDAASRDRDIKLIVLDEALNRLASRDPRQSRIVVEMRFFGGLSIDESSEALNVSRATVKREWTVARAWLYREMARSEMSDS